MSWRFYRSSGGCRAGVLQGEDRGTDAWRLHGVCVKTVVLSAGELLFRCCLWGSGKSIAAANFERRAGRWAEGTCEPQAGIPAGELLPSKGLFQPPEGLVVSRVRGNLKESFSHLCSLVNGLLRALEAGFLQRLRHVFLWEES